MLFVIYNNSKLLNEDQFHWQATKANIKENLKLYGTEHENK